MAERKPNTLSFLGVTIYELQEPDLGLFNYLTSPQGKDFKECLLLGAYHCSDFLKRVSGYRILEPRDGYPVCMEFYELKKLPEILSR